MRLIILIIILFPSLGWSIDLICTHQHVSDDANTTFWDLDLFEDKLILKKAVLDNGKELNTSVEHSLYDFQNNIVKSFKDTSNGRIEIYLNIKTGAMSNSYNDWPVDCKVIEEKINTNSYVNSKSPEMENYKNQCQNIGYTPNTEKFADCVMKLYMSDNKSNDNSKSEFLEIEKERLAIEKQQLEAERKRQSKIESDKTFNTIMDLIQCLGNTQFCSSAYDTRCYNDMLRQGYTQKLAYKTCKLN